ncbi:MAG: excalibur calcium-binding domain-containing protein [Chloroflexota bacterium]
MSFSRKYKSVLFVILACAIVLTAVGGLFKSDKGVSTVLAQAIPDRTPTPDSETVPTRTPTPTAVPITSTATPNIPSQSFTLAYLPVILVQQATPTAVPTLTPTPLLYECSFDQYNCSDFSSQAEAQIVFDYCYQLTNTDIHRLDENNNLIACEPTPTPLPPSTSTPTPNPTSTPTPSVSFVCSSNFYNCSDFSTQAAAQQVYDYCQAQGAGDIHRLDRDGNGIACESLPREPGNFRLDLAHINRP